MSELWQKCHKLAFFGITSPGLPKFKGRVGMRILITHLLCVVLCLLMLAVINGLVQAEPYDVKEKVLWSFGNGTDGSLPVGGIMDTTGNLYGTTYGGGAYGLGTVFQLTPPSTRGANWTESILWNFGNGTDGIVPRAALIMDTSGNLYGTTASGGTYPYGGTVFKLTPPSASDGNWTESILWSFGNGTDGKAPYAPLLMDNHGNLYGTTFIGGVFNNGTVFELTRPTGSGGNWTESILWNFGSSGNNDGTVPTGGLIGDANGNLYGATSLGGIYSILGGTVFQLTPPSTRGANWTESILWSFGNGTDGINPSGELIMDMNGNLYGTTETGGAYDSMAGTGGTVFELTPPAMSGGNWTESILWNFQNGTNGQNPGDLIMDARGDFYGTAAGGANTGGVAFRLTPRGNESTLWNFGNTLDGTGPTSLIMDRRGNLYGTTGYGGAYANGDFVGGTVFEIFDRSVHKSFRNHRDWSLPTEW
jgi:uncharacterized repeat protein (TIGR03803 family)